MISETQVNPASLQSLGHQIVERALALGATDAEVVAIEGEEFHVKVRLGQVEQLVESGSRGIGLRVFRATEGGQRTASTSTSDLSEDGIARLISGAVELAKITGVDPFAGLPEREAFGALPVDDLALYFEDVNAIAPAERIEMARRCEAAALSYDTRIQNTSGADCEVSTSHRVIVNSRGFRGEYRRSYCGFSVSPIAQDATGAMQRDFWYSSARTAQLLEEPETIGTIAAQRALRRLGARRVPTQECSVIFPAEVARGLRSTATLPCSLASLASRWRVKTSRWSMTARWCLIASFLEAELFASVVSELRRLMETVCRRAGLWSSSAAC